MVSSKKTVRLNNFLKKIQTYIYIFLFSQSLRKPLRVLLRWSPYLRYRLFGLHAP